MRNLAGVMAALMVLPASAMAESCQPLPAGFEICLQGTEWAGAPVQAFENGIAYEIDDLWLEIREAPEAIRLAEPFDEALPALQEMIAEQARNEGLSAPETLFETRDATATLELITVQTRIDLPEDEPLVFISMVAAAETQRLLLTLTNRPSYDLGALEDLLRRLAAQISLVQEG